MPLTYADVEKKKEWVADELKASLKDKFNMCSLDIAHGVTQNENGDPDFEIMISHLSRPDDLVDDEVIAFAKKKVQELVPGSKPRVVAIPVPRAF